MKKKKITMRKNITKLEEELYKLNNENEKVLNTLKEESKKSSLKDTNLNVYFRRKKSNETKIRR